MTSAPTTPSALLVTDIADHADQYTRALTADGFSVRRVPRGGDALDALALARPAVAIVDTRLPDMTGWELCKTLKERHIDVRIIMLNGDVGRIAVGDIVEFPCRAWVTQPPTAVELVDIVQHVLDAQPSTQEQIQ